MGVFQQPSPVSVEPEEPSPSRPGFGPGDHATAIRLTAGGR